MRRVLFAVLVATAVAGCSSSNDSKSDAKATTAPPPSSEAAPSTSASPPSVDPLVMPAGCLAAPDQLLATINASFNDSSLQLVDAWSVAGQKDVTYIGGNIFAGEKRVSSGDVWAAKGGAIFSLSSDARSRTVLPDGRKILDISAGDEYGSLVSNCVTTAVRIRNTGPR